MKIDIITLFPDMFKGPFDMSMLWKAKDRGLAEIRMHDLRHYGLGSRRTVDDTPYGGGDGIKKDNPEARVIVLSPQGKKFDQAKAMELSKQSGLVLLAGHYEGFDERILTYVDDELSIGDYVLTGGELPAMVMVDAVVRLIPGVLGGEQSAHVESFSDGLLEYPQYTRPVEFRGERVPEVLQNGHHAEIEAWRKQKSLEKTHQNRPDLLHE
jgi:tRNA (guanine37-N1)-methyltransferase